MQFSRHDSLRSSQNFENLSIVKISEFQVIVYCPVPKNANSELGKCIFYGIAKILIGPVGFERKQTNLACVFWVESFDWLRKIPSYRFSVQGKKR